MRNPYDQFVIEQRLKKRAAQLGTASNSATGDFATAAQGAKADTALQSVPDATTSVKGLVKKSAAITNGAPGILTISIGGSVSLTLASITGAIYATDSGAIKDALTSIADAVNKINARLEEMILNQQTAGQQT